MFTWENVGWVWDHFGIPGTAVIMLFGVVAFWPQIKAILMRFKTFVDTIQIVSDLPERFAKLDANNVTMQSGLTALTTSLNTHLDDAKTKTALLIGVDARLVSIESKATVAADKAEVAADAAGVAAARAEIAATQAVNNGGSSMKDKVDYAIPSQLQEIKEMLAKLIPPEGGGA